MQKEKGTNNKTIAVIAVILIIAGMAIGSNVEVLTEWLVGNQTPSIVLLTPADDSQITENTTTFTWNASDEDPYDVLTNIYYIDIVDTFSSYYLREVDVGENETYDPDPLYDGNWYWRVSVDDGEESNVSATWNLTVKTNLSNSHPLLSSPSVLPTSGNSATTFIYTVTFSDADNTTPVFIYVRIDGVNYSMSEVDAGDVNVSDGKNYTYSTTLSVGNDHNYSFIAFDGDAIIATAVVDNPDVAYVGLAVPTQSNPVPANGSMQVVIPLDYFSITINDADGQNMNVSLWTNYSGSWVMFNMSLGLGNGTYQFTNTSWIVGLGVMVYWSVNLTDAVYWVNETYWFVTETIDVVPVYPENNSVVSPQPYLVFELVTPTGDSMNYTVYVGNSSVNTTTVLASASGVGNASFNHLYVIAVNNSEDYFWRVYAYDGTLFVNETFNFGVSTSMGGFITMGNSFAFVLALGGWIFGVAGLIFALIVYTKKGSGEGKGKKKPRKTTGRVRGF